MVNDINEIIEKEILLTNNKKIKEKSLEEFLADFKRNELLSFGTFYLVVNGEFGKLIINRELANKPKKLAVNFVTENLEDILIGFLKYMSKNLITVLNEIVLRIERKDYEVSDTDLTYNDIVFLKNVLLFNVEYNKSNNSLKMFIPDEYVNMLKKLLKNKDIIKENELIEKITNYVVSLLDIYGIIPIEKLYEYVNKKYEKMDFDEFSHIIMTKSLLADNINIYHFDEDIVVCQIEFDEEDYAYNFYLEQKGKYKAYTKKEIENFANNTYIRKLDSYQDFLHYLDIRFENILDDLQFIEELIIFDYMYMRQTSLEIAKDTFEKKMSNMFEISKKEINELQKMLESIYKMIPKWSKRGNI